MNKLFSKLSVNKMDEMEMSIALRAKRNAMFFVKSALFIWMAYYVIKASMNYDYEVNWLPIIILLVTIGIENISIAIMKHNATAGDEEYEAEREKKSAVSIGASAIVGVIVLCIIAIAVAAVLRIFFFQIGVLS